MRAGRLKEVGVTGDDGVGGGEFDVAAGAGVDVGSSMDPMVEARM
jgi:hypothetical protein